MINLIVAVHHRIGPGTRPPLLIQHCKIIKRLIGCRQLVYLVTACLTFPTADATRVVEQNPYTIGIAREMFGCSGTGRFAHGRAQACCS